LAGQLGVPAFLDINHHANSEVAGTVEIFAFRIESSGVI
jgi:hypothetical protein